MGKDRLDKKLSKYVVWAMARTVGIRYALKEMISDVCSTSERADRDCLSESLGCKMMLSRTSALTMYRMRQNKCSVVVTRRIMIKAVYG